MKGLFDITNFKTGGIRVEENDDKIIEGIKNKNPKALSELIDKYNSAIACLVQRILGNLAQREDIEECVSDVFVDIWNNIGGYDISRGSFKTWVLIKGKYKALDYRRSLNKKIDMQFNNDMGDESLGNINGFDSSNNCNSAESEFFKKETLKIIVKALESFKEIDRRIFKSRYFFYEDIQSIADRYNLTRQAVDNRLYRSRKCLREILNNSEINL